MESRLIHRINDTPSVAGGWFRHADAFGLEPVIDIHETLPVRVGDIDLRAPQIDSYHPSTSQIAGHAGVVAGGNNDRSRLKARVTSQSQSHLDAKNTAIAQRYWSVGRPYFFFKKNLSPSVTANVSLFVEHQKVGGGGDALVELVRGKAIYLAKDANPSHFLRVSIRKLKKDFRASMIAVGAMFSLRDDEDSHDQSYAHIGRAMLSVMFRHGGAGFEQDMIYSHNLMRELSYSQLRSAYDRLLFLSCGSGKAFFIERILLAGASPNAEYNDLDRKTALSYAILTGNKRAVVKLLMFGADPDFDGGGSLYGGREAAIHAGDQDAIAMLSRFGSPRVIGGHASGAS